MVCARSPAPGASTIRRRLYGGGGHAPVPQYVFANMPRYRKVPGFFFFQFNAYWKPFPKIDGARGSIKQRIADKSARLEVQIRQLPAVKMAKNGAEREKRAEGNLRVEIFPPHEAPDHEINQRQT